MQEAFFLDALEKVLGNGILDGLLASSFWALMDLALLKGYFGIWLLGLGLFYLLANWLDRRWLACLGLH